MNQDKKNIAIVVNPLAGSGRGVELAKKITSLLLPNALTPHLFIDNWPAHFNAFTDIWIVGGDGTLHYFINHYPDIQLPLVIFPGGSGNDFHWMLYGNKSLEELIEIALSANPQKVDSGRCNGRLFLNGTGVGFEGVVAKSLTGKNKKKGKASFYKAVLKKIITYREQSFHLFTEHIKLQGKYLIISIMNGHRAGGGFHIAPGASITDGLLEVTIIDPLSILKRLRYLPVIEKGKHLKLPFVHHFKSASLQISSDQDMDAHLDGEYFSSNYIAIETLPGKFLFRY